jgi:L-ascorbate metabolism protein UlaG (beta-lactamase superfamily)
MKNLFCFAIAVLMTLSCGVTKVPSVKITYQGGSQVMVITPSGNRIFIDVSTASMLPKNLSAKDTLLATHDHNDHYIADWAPNFPGHKLFFTKGQITLSDAVITCLPSAHDTKDPIKDTGGTDYIMLIETAGLRIAHFGDIGQDALTEDQMKALGHIDVAFIQTDNNHSTMDSSNKKGFKLMEQFKPTLVMFTHTTLSSLKYAMTNFQQPYWAAKTDTIVVNKGNLPKDGIHLVVIGSNALNHATQFPQAIPYPQP